MTTAVSPPAKLSVCVVARGEDTAVLQKDDGMAGASSDVGDGCHREGGGFCKALPLLIIARAKLSMIVRAGSEYCA